MKKEIGLNKDKIKEENKQLLSNINNETPLENKNIIFYNSKDLITESYLYMEYVGETIERLVKSLLGGFEFSIKNKNFYSYLIREIMRNVIEHSQAEEIILLLYSNNIKEFGFKVIDFGIGIRRSLNSNPNYSVEDDKTALAFSLRPGITKSYKNDPYRDEIWQNSGFGLYMVSTIINEIGGRFEIASGNHKIIYKSGFKEYSKSNTKGTEVTVVFNTTNKIDTARIINETSLKGSDYLKNSDRFSYYAEVKTASKASILLNDN